MNMINVYQVISSTLALLGVVVIYYQIVKNQKIKEAEFIMNLNATFSGNPNIRAVYAKLETFEEGDEDPFSEEDVVRIAEYLSFFGTIAHLVDRKVLTIKMIDSFLSYRFFAAMNNPFVQQHQLIKDADYFGKLFNLYDDWLLYKKKRRKPEPFSKYALYNSSFDYKQYKEK
ncbi:hypothetical protein [Salisediminibacterium selenitireducens]|uniref:DUF4760 domain-containing protein n=1 Tax=Bacillus selenitireducens (strain ATCC 700615 / DSM 15326 / MLS10) TaxID=439292 RepID=D6Y0K9_BACIE|nr:hypothetical protein [Salisediminibacterium selenitireducens]ADI00577.1 hypothetical protein Bsel_3095 [[Bacillus] selenitireducens MLS10]